MDVSEACRGVVRRHAHRHDVVRSRRRTRRVSQHAPECRNVAHHLVRREDRRHGILASASLDHAAGRRHRSGGVAPARLGHDIRARQFRQLRPRRFHESLPRHNQHALGRHKSLQPVDGLAQKRLAAEHRKELLRTFRRGERPEPLAAPAGKDHRVEITEF